ncbi:MAG: GNAT family N-acetyltransferase [Candidatus Eisenbacteria bacterium]|uniref:GNAT family N-acetyltransferase n=1 Tax=Eiseniibacteriota bacterium TaxID=2212470 RepID=A0A538TQM5_UNCEI|nr:MAG: GNAT family N-acetyltransferase [Candidatus Eisenbacteria bacterium]
MTAFIVRRANSGKRDIDLIAPLFDSYRQFYDEPADAELAAAFIGDRLQAEESVIFLAEEGGEGNGEALGFVQLYPSFSSVAACRIWVLNDLFVAPEARGRGVGRALMGAAREHAIQTGAKRLTLETTSENRTAWSLYEDLGYVRQKDSVRVYTLELG